MYRYLLNIQKCCCIYFQSSYKKFGNQHHSLDKIWIQTDSWFRKTGIAGFVEYILSHLWGNPRKGDNISFDIRVREVIQYSLLELWEATKWGHASVATIKQKLDVHVTSCITQKSYISSQRGCVEKLLVLDLLNTYCAFCLSNKSNEFLSYQFYFHKTNPSISNC